MSGQYNGYTGEKDAVKIIEKVMKRRNYGSQLVDDLARELEKIVSRELCPSTRSKGKMQF